MQAGNGIRLGGSEAASPFLTEVYKTRKKQYNNIVYRHTALGLKLLRKIVYK